MIIDNNGLQQFWTLFKLGSLPIKISAGWVIRNCLSSIEVCFKINMKKIFFIFFVKNHGELIRSFDGIFYLLLNTLSTDNVDLLSVTLAIIAEIIKDKDNLQILTDLGIVSKISQLNNLVNIFIFLIKYKILFFLLKENYELKRAFSDTISNLLNLQKNREELGNRNVMIILKNYLKEQDQQLYKPLTKAIYDLSLIPSNCIILHEVGISSV